MSNREIASRLGLTEHTVKNYLFRIFDKLGVSSRVEVVLYAFRFRKDLVGSPVPEKKSVTVPMPVRPHTPVKSMMSAVAVKGSQEPVEAMARRARV
jgi:DNA-binding Lrp family transcriptional regulator